MTGQYQQEVLFMNRTWIAFVALAGFTAAAGAQNADSSKSTSTPAPQSSSAQSSKTTQQATTAAAKEQVFGYQLMTPAERTEYRTKMRALKTQEERDTFRLEHHQKMLERAKEKGVTLPAVPPAQGMGAGMGQGNGMGTGPGMGRNRAPAAAPSGPQGQTTSPPSPKE
jgi:hypothetical protein